MFFKLAGQLVDLNLVVMLASKLLLHLSFIYLLHHLFILSFLQFFIKHLFYFPSIIIIDWIKPFLSNFMNSHASFLFIINFNLVIAISLFLKHFSFVSMVVMLFCLISFLNHSIFHHFHFKLLKFLALDLKNLFKFFYSN